MSLNGLGKASSVILTLLAAGLVAFVGLGSSASGVGEPSWDEGRYCTAIGCTSGVAARLKPLLDAHPKRTRFKICVNGRCRNIRDSIPRDFFTSKRIRAGEPVRIRVVGRKRSGKLVYRDRIRTMPQRVQPNGPKCPPVCWVCKVKVDPKTLRLETPA